MELALDENNREAINLLQRSRTGCQQCRRRKRKCDEQHPRCTGCIRRNLPCNWQRDIIQRQRVARRHTTYNREFTLPGQIHSLMTIFTVPSASLVDLLLSYFITNSPLWLTIGGEEKGKASLELIMPAGNRSLLVRHCVLALAAGDLSKYQPMTSDMAGLSQGFYGQAVTGLQSSLGEALGEGVVQDKLTGDDILLAILLLCVHEAVNFINTDRLLPHVKVATPMCYDRSFSATQNPHLRGYLFELFIYIFVLTSFSYPQSLPLHLVPIVYSSPFLSGSHYQGILLGQSDKIFYCIMKMSTLTSNIASSPIVNNDAIDELNVIDIRLADLCRTRSVDKEESATDESIASELYRFACMMHLKAILNPEPTILQDLVGKFIQNLELLPLNSPTTNVLCWPLFVAGMSITIVPHRRLIITRLQKMYEIWRTDIVSRSINILSETWKKGAGLAKSDVTTLYNTLALHQPTQM